jgi:hypothetical protein
VHCLLEGRGVLSGRPADLSVADVERAYFGLRSGPAPAGGAGTAPGNGAGGAPDAEPVEGDSR